MQAQDSYSERIFARQIVKNSAAPHLQLERQTSAVTGTFQRMVFQRYERRLRQLLLRIPTREGIWILWNFSFRDRQCFTLLL